MKEKISQGDEEPSQQPVQRSRRQVKEDRNDEGEPVRETPAREQRMKIEATAKAGPRTGTRDRHPIAIALKAADPAADATWQSATAITWHERPIRPEDRCIVTADPYIQKRAEEGFLATQLSHDPRVREWNRKVILGEEPKAIGIVADLKNQTLRAVPERITADLGLNADPDIQIDVHEHTGIQLQMNDEVRRILTEHGIGVRISNASEVRQWQPRKDQ